MQSIVENSKNRKYLRIPSWLWEVSSPSIEDIFTSMFFDAGSFICVLCFCCHSQLKMSQKLSKNAIGKISNYLATSRRLIRRFRNSLRISVTNMNISKLLILKFSCFKWSKFLRIAETTWVKTFTLISWLKVFILVWNFFKKGLIGCWLF